MRWRSGPCVIFLMSLTKSYVWLLFVVLFVAAIGFQWSGIGDAAWESRPRASLPAGGGPPLLVTAVLRRRWFPVFPSFFFAFFFSLRYGPD
jgi:hypothetical protein